MAVERFIVKVLSTFQTILRQIKVLLFIMKERYMVRILQVSLKMAILRSFTILVI